MAELTPGDEQLLRLMREQDLITPSQEARVRQAVKKGRSLGEAVSRTPLVDPVKFASLQSYAAHHAPSDPGSAPPAGEKKEQGPPPFQPIRAEDDQPVALDLDLDTPETDSLDLDYEVRDLGPVGTPETPCARELDQDVDVDLDPEPDPPPRRPPPPTDTVRPPSVAELRRQALRKREQAETPSAESAEEAGPEPDQPAAAAPKPKSPAPASAASLPEPDDPQSYLHRNMQLQSYDLSDDEGISLIRQVNEMLQDSLDAGDAGLRLMPGVTDGPNLTRYGRDRAERAAEELEASQAEKLANRLKVMGRLEAWRRQPSQRGAFDVISQGRRYRVLLDFSTGEGDGETEVLTVHFLRG